jgi:sugar transferase (PEP-CTERM/EpsH1 system associated)
LTDVRELLFLAHRIPYPPQKGDKIRSWHILSHLSQRYAVHLACFVDNPDDWQHVDHLRTVCGECYFAELKPSLAKLRCLTGLVTGEALTLPFYRDAGLRAWVQDLVGRRKVEGCYVFSSAMAQFVCGDAFDSLRRVIDFVDVDSEKWRQYAARKPWPASWLYRREGQRLLQYDRAIAAAFDVNILVSTAEAELFKTLSPGTAQKTFGIRNGVDSDYFSPDRHYENPYPSGDSPLVLTGAMDYWPNAEAAVWFAKEVLPSVRQSVPAAAFYIVGSDPLPEVRQLERLPGVTVTGRVPDIRSYLAHASIAVAPLRVGRGVQNKVLEAMAMALPVVATPDATEGLDVSGETLVAGDARAFTDRIVSLLRSADRKEIGSRARAKVVSNCGWATSLGRLTSLLEGEHTVEHEGA